MENGNVGLKFRPFSMYGFNIISLVDCLALWNEFEENNTLDIEDSNEHHLQL